MEIAKDMEHNSVEQMLIYAVEMLGSEAFHILSRVGNVIDLKDTTNLRQTFSSINFSSTRKTNKTAFTTKLSS
jgi:hypothetical protein